MRDPLRVPCPACHAAIGQPCFRITKRRERGQRSHPRTAPHWLRWQAVHDTPEPTRAPARPTRAVPA